MSEKYKLSVIVPIYKVEEYLEVCVRSIINQNYKNIEVILVDDGSPDCCPQICDALAKEDKRIQVIHKLNGGLSSARNAGIDKSSGEYITFLDSDDRWDDDKLADIMEQVEAHNVDMIFLKSLSSYHGGDLRERPDNEFFTHSGKLMTCSEIYPLFISEGNMREQAGTHILKKAFVIENSLYFKEGILGEDTEWMFRAMRVVDKMLILNKHLQIYTSCRPGSITNNISLKSLNDLILVITECISYNQKISSPSDIRHWELAQCAYLWSTAVAYYSMLSSSQYTKQKNILKNLYNELPMHMHPKTRIVNRVYRLLGFTLTSKLLNVYIRLRKQNLVRKTQKYNENPKNSTCN